MTLISLFLFPLLFSFVHSVDPEVTALCDIKTNLNPFTWRNNVHSPCGMDTPCQYTFPGVVCDDKREHVIALNLYTDGMDGVIPQTIKDLIYLQTLNLRENRISGDLPDLSALTNLKILDVSQTKINGGVIPDWICKLKLLQQIGFSSTQRTGTVPECVLGFGITSLSLANNEITGDLSDFFYKLPKLRSLDVSNNQNFAEFFPSAVFCNATTFDLTHLKMSNVNLKGDFVDCDDSLLENLFTIDLSLNNLSGLFPINFIKTRKSLKTFNFGSNGFTGIIDDSVLTALDTLAWDVSYNKIDCNNENCNLGQFYSGFIPKYSGTNNAIIITFLVISIVAFVAVLGFFTWRTFRKTNDAYQSI